MDTAVSVTLAVAAAVAAGQWKHMVVAGVVFATWRLAWALRRRLRPVPSGAESNLSLRR